MRSIFSILIILLGIMLTACGSAGTLTLTPTLTQTDTPQPPPTSTFTPTANPPSTTPTPSPAPQQIEVYGVSWLGSGDLLITLQGEKPFSGEYFLDLQGYSYNCRIAQDSDQLMFCVGRIAPQGSSVPIYLMRDEDGEKVFQTNILVPIQESSPNSSGSDDDPPAQTPDLTPDPTSPGPTP